LGPLEEERGTSTVGRSSVSERTMSMSSGVEKEKRDMLAVAQRARW
jgi:hypothetical protein